mmetsp:Transcript_14466/g.35938  ORF Transcript_14466/g.35938 Transcript_14466/m.35938 type:complete len:232 (-) Transcript_14466:990-1685(-)
MSPSRHPGPSFEAAARTGPGLRSAACSCSCKRLCRALCALDLAVLQRVGARSLDLVVAVRSGAVPVALAIGDDKLQAGALHLDHLEVIATRLKFDAWHVGPALAVNVAVQVALAPPGAVLDGDLVDYLEGRGRSRGHLLRRHRLLGLLLLRLLLWGLCNLLLLGGLLQGGLLLLLLGRAWGRSGRSLGCRCLGLPCSVLQILDLLAQHLLLLRPRLLLCSHLLAHLCKLLL